MSSARGHDQIIVANIEFRGLDRLSFEIEANDLGHEDLNVFMSSQNGADRLGNFPGRKARRGNLIEQGLKSVMILAIDHRNLNWSLSQSPGRVQAAESRSYNHHPR